MKIINHPTFYIECHCTYPPFKNGLYLEEYFFRSMQQNGLEKDKNGRRYIPAFWTNFQINPVFRNQNVQLEMYQALNRFIRENPCKAGYFTVVQHDDGPSFPLPPNTLIYSGGGTGHIPIALMYEDISQTLVSKCKERNLGFHDKTILCSFIGNDTHVVRKKMTEILSGKPGFDIQTKTEWAEVVAKEKQNHFIETTLKSKFALAPRGYGRTSFRFYEILQLGTIPIYIWDDIEFLPYKECIDYSKFCISIHVDEIDTLESRLLAIDETKYIEMGREYERISNVFSLEFMCYYIQYNPNPISL